MARSDDAQLLAIAARAGAANPFGEERRKLDEALTGGAHDEPSFLGAIGRLDVALERHAGPSRLARASGADRSAMERAILFEAFHRYLREMDALVAKQRAAGAVPVRATFARSLLAHLVARGIEDARAERWLVLFFQMRRCFLFLTDDLAGGGRSMQRLRESLWNAVFTCDLARYEAVLWDRMEDFATLLLGETGTGKGVAAAAIGRAGLVPFDAKSGAFAPSFTESFVPVSLAELPESLLESELFGHEKGAFTGALFAHEGLLQRTRRHGAIFLDEIGELAPHVQVKLLRVLQERAFTPVGGRKVLRFEGRVIAATHRPIDELRRDGRFRDDFFYRLSTEAIVVPPLRARLAEDPRELEALVTHVVARTLGAPSAEVTSEVLAAITRDLGPQYAWPGNVRELEQCVRAVLLSGRCAPDGRASGDDEHGALLDTMRDGTLTADRLLDRYCALLYARHPSYEAVARITRLDRRTVKRRVLAASAAQNPPAR
jgi:hypothetical protein